MHYYGGDHYPDNIILVNPQSPPDGYESGVIDALYDFDNTWLRAHDIETMQQKLPAGEQMTLLNPDTNAICFITTDGLTIRPAHPKGFAHLWRRHTLNLPLEPEQASLLVHVQDYLDEAGA